MIDPPPQRSNRSLALLIFASFGVLSAAVVIRLGLGNTPYDATDSLGRTMGFNDPLYAEHYRIIVSNFRPSHLFAFRHFYEWLLLAAQIMGASLLLARATTGARLTRWYFVGQWLIFPLGGLFVVFAPLMMYQVLQGQPSDREGFVDIPFVMLVGQGSWLMIATIIAFAMKGRDLGLRRVWFAINRAVHPDSKTSAGTIE
jgi:hypothetical protein